MTASVVRLAFGPLVQEPNEAGGATVHPVTWRAPSEITAQD
jgi:hypothetical protein